MASSVKLQQLRAFRAIMLTGSVSQAARNLNLTQPAISKQVSLLESVLGIHLFERRRGGPMVPTGEAIEFFNSIEATLAGIEKIGVIAHKITERSQARIRVAATPPIVNSSALASALQSFRLNTPSTSLALESRYRMDIEEWVANHQVELGLALLPARHPDLLELPLVTTRAVAVFRKDVWDVGHDAVDIESLAGQNLILPSRQPLRDKFDACFDELHLGLEPHIDCSSAYTCASLAANGLGIAVCDPLSASSFSRPGINILEITPRIELAYGAIMRKDSRNNPVIETFLEHLKSKFKGEFA
ncbi:MAG: LysR family transcriptional regulator [Pseudomonadota bacterium]